MKNGQFIAPIYKLSLRDPETVPRRISYSQWSTYEMCPHKWKLAYIDRLVPFNDSIDTVFGTAFHETLQYFLQIMYTTSVTVAEQIDLKELLITNLRNEYKRAVEANDGTHFSNPLQLAEYINDGEAILHWFKKNRRKYFSSKDYELVGIELDLCTQASESNPSVFWYGFIDLVIRHIPTNTIKLIDIKTSRNGWNQYQKADNLKSAQLVAYKNYFSKQFGIPVDNIEIEFFIVKRKIQEDSMFPQKRIQQHIPASGSVTQRKVNRMIAEFVDHCFDQDGEKKEDNKYLAVAGKGSKNCKYCPFKEDYEKCPKEDRIKQ
jgi:hypothetical protein